MVLGHVWLIIRSRNKATLHFVVPPRFCNLRACAREVDSSINMPLNDSWRKKEGEVWHVTSLIVYMYIQYKERTAVWLRGNLEIDIVTSSRRRDSHTLMRNSNARDMEGKPNINAYAKSTFCRMMFRKKADLNFSSNSLSYSKKQSSRTFKSHSPPIKKKKLWIFTTFVFSITLTEESPSNCLPYTNHPEN